MTPLAAHALQQIQLYRWKRRQWRHRYTATKDIAMLQNLAFACEMLARWRRILRIASDFEPVKE